MLTRQIQRGVTLVEIVITLAILSLLLGLAYPSYTAWLTNLQIRSATEKMLSGLQLARAEAMKSNTTVRFSLVDNMTNACALLDTGSIAIVSRSNPAGKCDIGASDTVEPFISQILAMQEGSARVNVTATDGAGNARTNVVFNGLGRVLTATDWIRQIDFDVPPANANRALRLQISASGQIRMCDPAVVSTTDTRKC
ncbi:MAG TPA: GspH/FimT family pseudopilin [Noviherbaspirillum sp.]|nr:GspH/FimT family pseudopilin [Noviherbaspirillum sp.]